MASGASEREPDPVSGTTAEESASVPGGGPGGPSDGPRGGPSDGPRGGPSGDRPSRPPSVARRNFFRALAGEVAQTAAAVAAAAASLQRSSAEAAAAILGESADLGPQAAPNGSALGAPLGFRSAFRWDDDRLVLVDQRALPDELREVTVTSATEAAQAIRDMVVRGAPAIGQVAAIALALTARRMANARPYARRATIRGSANALRNARPTAVNLGWAVDRMLRRYAAVGELNEDGQAVAAALWAEAEAIVFEANEDHGRLAEAGAAELPVPEGRPLEILTHCNTGPLACGQFGTALGVVAVAHHAGRPLHVWVDETRPLLQGARLTAWELASAGVPHTLIADGAAGHLMARGRVDIVLVGADRIAANGDAANKIGTYTLAVLAARHGIPFWVCAPLSSVDPDVPDGASIPIEERPAAEVLFVRGRRIAPAVTEAHNPAFDVTPAELIGAIVTEEGVLRPPFAPALAAALERKRRRVGGATPATEAIEAVGPDDAHVSGEGLGPPAGPDRVVGARW
jgi:methylthioribose-1-phosphate isomerase